MGPQIALGCLLVLLTTAVHGMCTLLALGVLRQEGRWFHWQHAKLTAGTLLVSSLVVLLFLASLLEASIWAYVYLRVGALEDLEAALYFSTVTFTTLGYGDITLGTDWRLLATFEAANGTMMFGWSTSLVIAYVQRLSSHRSDS